MKNFFSFVIKNPMILALLFIAIVFLPNAISAPPEGVQRQYVATIGLDLSPEGIELSILTHVSRNSATYNETYIINSATAESIPRALYKIATVSGRQISLTHATSIVVSEQIARQGLHNFLDYFYRNETIANDTFVICAMNSTAKDLLAFEKDRVNSTGYGLEELLAYNSQNTFFVNSDVENFYKGYFSPTKTSVVALATLEKNTDNEQVLQGGGSSGEGASAAQNESKRIKSAGTLGLLKAGRLVDTMTEDDIFGYNLVNNQTHNIYLRINNFSDELFENATVDFNIVTNKVAYISSFENGRPVFTLNSLVSLALQSATADEVKKEYFLNSVNPLSQKMKEAVVQKLRGAFSSFMQKIIANKTDVFGVYTTLNNQHKKEFQAWLQNLQDPENFLAYVEYRMNPNPILTT
ncbi:MAG: Ger(x)C family spore germination C-terminal domain-containing protein [Clostridia bacterium]